jgi:hypothetical protein
MCVTEWREECTFPANCHCGAPTPSCLKVSNSVGCVVKGNVCYGNPCTIEPGACTAEP